MWTTAKLQVQVASPEVVGSAGDCCRASAAASSRLALLRCESIEWCARVLRGRVVVDHGTAFPAGGRARRGCGSVLRFLAMLLAATAWSGRAWLGRIASRHVAAVAGCGRRLRRRRARVVVVVMSGSSEVALRCSTRSQGVQGEREVVARRVSRACPRHAHARHERRLGAFWARVVRRVVAAPSTRASDPAASSIELPLRYVATRPGYRASIFPSLFHAAAERGRPLPDDLVMHVPSLSATRSNSSAMEARPIAVVLPRLARQSHLASGVVGGLPRGRPTSPLLNRPAPPLRAREMASPINFNQFLEKEKLKSNGSNFTDWFRHVRIFLSGGNLQFVLDAPLGDPPAEDESDEVKAVYATRKTRYSQVQCAILCSLESDLQKRFEHHDPHELMNELKAIFETHAAVECYEASKHFFSCMMEEGSSVSEHMLAMTGHAKKLSDLGIVIPNRLGINRVLQSLPPSYKNFVMNYNMQNMNKELPELFGMLKAAEIEIKKEHQVLMVNKTTGFKKQGKSKGKFKKGGKKAATPPMKPKNGPKPDAECYYCKEKGHWKRNCSKYLADLSGLVKKKKEGIFDIHVIDVHFTGSRTKE
ncbi:hypothetical protein QYE76_066171 [Lolium multiflorum]|uniref:CCHC-type domain-containing protein n=1 Tax=Lolium multiflorum TaxID=4521 RepID=A0AAD8S9Z0_LOLMU|nr:hypothetical protein QYE76_066171 [Lolium multiflorum]